MDQYGGQRHEHWNANATFHYRLPLTSDKAGKTSSSGFFNKTTSWFYVNGLHVEAPASTRAIVMFGGSITDGLVDGSAVSPPASSEQNDANGRYPDALQRRLNTAGLPISVIDAGISGNQLLQPGALFGPSGLSRLAVDALTKPGVAGTAINTWIRPQALADGGVDFDAAMRNPCHVIASPFSGARKRLSGTRLVATDQEWSAGKGPDEVRGPAGDLLLLATGRAAGLAAVTGPGAERIAAAL